MRQIFMFVACVAIFLGAGPLEAGAKDGSPVAGVLKKYDGKPGVESFNLGKFLLNLGRLAADDGDDEGEFLKYLDRMAIFDGEDASADVKASMLKDLKKALEGYETMIEMKDGEDSLTIYCRMKNEDVIEEVVMVEESDLAIIMMKGRIPLSKIQDIAKEAMEE